MQRITTMIAFLFTILMATAAQAKDGRSYLGLDATMPYGATWQVGSAPDEKISAGIPLKLTVGYAFNDRWAFEISRLAVKVSKNGVSESITAVPVNLVYHIPLSAQTGLLLNGGLVPFTGKFNSASTDASASLIGASLGLGIKHQLTESVGVIGGINYLNGYRYKFSNGNRYDLSPAHVYLGMRLGF